MNPDEEALEFYKKVLTLLYNYSQDDAPIYWWFANKNKENLPTSASYKKVV